MKISEIINISCRLMLKEDERIYPPRSTSKNFNGFSQKTIEEIIRDKSLEMEFKKLNFLLQVICQKEENSQIFLHTVSKSILFKKRKYKRGC